MSINPPIRGSIAKMVAMIRGGSYMSQSPYKGFNRMAVGLKKSRRTKSINPPIRGSIGLLRK